MHRLGDLGGIAKEFDVAVSTACGALDHYVVATTEIAQECVKTLRAKELGVASFIVLDKQGHLAPRMAPIATPDGSQRLFDLIDSDEQWRPAFYFALQDTLVCAGAELANSIAFGKKRWRVVTTEGVVINTSGTMEGGGKPLSGRMGSAPVAATGASDADVAKLEGAERAAAARAAGRARRQGRRGGEAEGGGEGGGEAEPGGEEADDGARRGGGDGGGAHAEGGRPLGRRLPRRRRRSGRRSSHLSSRS